MSSLGTPVPSVVKVIRSIKLKISDTRLDAIEARSTKASNWLAAIVFKNKELNSNKLQRLHYKALRKKGISAQLCGSICKRVASAYRSQKSQGRWSQVEFKAPVVPVVYNRDFSRTKKGPKLWGQPLIITDSRPLPEHWRDSKLIRRGKQWYLVLAYQADIPDPKPTGSIVGVDAGIKRMLTATNSANQRTFFFHGGYLNHRRSCIRVTRAKVQAVGTRSSRRLLKRLSGHEAAVTGHLLHVASKALVAYAVAQNARRIVMEDLSNIRDASLNKGKDLRSKIHRWPFAALQFKVGYKAAAHGIETELVSPVNTSRGCNRCGHVAASNRYGLHFACGRCGHTDDADRHASQNIRCRSVLHAHACAARGNVSTPESSELPILPVRVV